MGVKLREKTLKSGDKSLFLDITIQGQRFKEYLNIVLIKPQTTDDRKHNKELKQLAESIRANKELLMAANDYNIVPAFKKNTNFLRYYENFLDNYSNKDKRLVKSSLDHFKEFIKTKEFKDNLFGKDVTEELCKQFKAYLDSKLNGETPHNYFTKFKKVLKQATKEKILASNPALDIKNIKTDGLKKDVLSIDEIQKLANTKAGNDDVKRAFLFCLNTGLRFCEVNELIWKNIDNNKMTVNQSKIEHSSTKSFKTIDLNSNCLKLIGERQSSETKLFNLPSFTGCLKVLKNWVKKAEIDKHITWHCSRHSFAVNLLNPDIARADIKTVSGLLGHSSLRHTEKYTRYNDELKKNAVNNLPDMKY